MSQQNGDEPELAPRMPVVLIRFWPGGRAINWLDCDVHEAIDVLRSSLQQLEQVHEQEHAASLEEAAGEVPGGA